MRRSLHVVLSRVDRIAARAQPTIEWSCQRRAGGFRRTNATPSCTWEWWSAPKR